MRLLHDREVEEPTRMKAGAYMRRLSMYVCGILSRVVVKSIRFRIPNVIKSILNFKPTIVRRSNRRYYHESLTLKLFIEYNIKCLQIQFIW